MLLGITTNISCAKSQKAEDNDNVVKAYNLTKNTTLCKGVNAFEL